ncbi:MAG: response regulator [Elusimicrobiales bacterium]|nr:response regulator [Elusimicrobiales bacterium]HPO95921.1 response regulator [Elusimicrobiales bacterium]
MSDRNKVLVVDDNPTMIDIVKMALESDYEVVSASDGREGISMAKTFKPDVIIMDVMMPNVSGIEMLRMLLSDDETRDIPVIVFTASHFDPSTEMVFKVERNVKSFLRKPCTVDILKQQVKSAIDSRKNTI